MALIVGVIAIALLGFILTDLFTGLSRAFGGAPAVGTVGGKEISYQAYEERVALISANNPSTTELQRNQLRDRAWANLTSEMLYQDEYKEIGLAVTDQELLDLFAGAHQDPIIAQYFPGRSPDQIKQQLKYLIENVSTNPQIAQQLSALEDYIAQNRMYNKLGKLVKASYVGSQEGARRKFVAQNRKANISFLAMNYTQIGDSLVTVSDSELEAYIRKNKEKYKQEPEAYVRYARFTLTPSAADTASAREKLLNWYASFSKSTNDSIYTSNKSSNPYTSPSYLPLSLIQPLIQDSIIGAANKTIFGPVQEGGVFKLYKVVGSQVATQASLKIESIQIRPSGSTVADTTTALDKARGIANGANAANFSQLMTENNGFEIGWYNQRQFGEDFDEALKNAQAGQVVGPIKSNGVFHIVHVLARHDREYDLAQIERNISVGNETTRDTYGKANAFAQLAQQKGSLNDAGSEANVTVFETNALRKSTNDIGVGGGRDIVLWAMNAEVGEQSNKVFTVENNYLYAEVSKKVAEGVRPLEEVRAEVELAVRNEKKAEMIIAELNKLAGQDLNAIKDAYGKGSYVSTANDVSFESTQIAGIGAEPYVIGRIASMKQGEISKPLKGKQGVYIVQVTGVTEAPEADAATLASTRMTNTTGNQFRLENGLQTILQEAANVEDNRAEAYAKINGYR